MDAEGFRQLWRVAYSAKAAVSQRDDDRLPIGQFGIGKLAAYVLAWRLTHISCIDDKILLTSMNFQEVSGKHQFDPTEPLQLSLREISEQSAKDSLRNIEQRDPKAWGFIASITLVREAHHS